MHEGNPLVVGARHQTVGVFGFDVGSFVFTVQVDTFQFFGQAPEKHTAGLEENAVAVFGKQRIFAAWSDKFGFAAVTAHSVQSGFFGKSHPLVQIAVFFSIYYGFTIRRKWRRSVNGFFGS